MTVVLSYRNEFMSIIMADDRINWGRNQEFGYEDGRTKLVNLTNMGWASGAGLAVFLDEFKSSLVTSSITSTDDIKIVFQEVLDNCKKVEPLWEDSINDSVAVISWVGVVENSIVFRIGILSNTHFGDELAIIENGNINIVYPGDFLEDLSKVEALERSFNLNIGVETDFSELLTYMLKIFDEISKKSPYVSRNCDIGIQTLMQDGIFKLKLSGEINDLIDTVRNKKVENKLEVISEIKF